MSDYQWNNEVARMMYALNAKKNSTDGFEGCKRCENPGYYLKKYSPEGYCDTCEAIEYPERYRACVCCRIPWSKWGALCGRCTSGISNHFDTIAIHLRLNSSQCHNLMCAGLDWERYMNKHVKKGSFISYEEAKKYPHIKCYNDGTYLTECWPGFYMGNGVWQKLDYLPKLDDNGIVIPEGKYYSPC